MLKAYDCRCGESENRELKIEFVVKNMLLLKYVEDDFKVLAGVVITLIHVSIMAFNIFVAIGIHVPLNV